MTRENDLEELRPGYEVWRPRVTLFQDADGPAYDMLKASRNRSAWLRDAMIALCSIYDVWYSSHDAAGSLTPAWQVSTVLVKGQDDDLAEFLYRLPRQRQRYLLRAAIWFQMGRQSVGHSLDVDDLAGKLVQAMQDQGVIVSAASPHEAEEEEQGEIEDTMLGQFLV